MMGSPVMEGGAGAQMNPQMNPQMQQIIARLRGAQTKKERDAIVGDLKKTPSPFAAFLGSLAGRRRP
jgi:hypothetical protein